MKSIPSLRSAGLALATALQIKNFISAWCHVCYFLHCVCSSIYLNLFEAISNNDHSLQSILPALGEVQYDFNKHKCEHKITKLGCVTCLKLLAIRSIQWGSLVFRGTELTFKDLYCNCLICVCHFK